MGDSPESTLFQRLLSCTSQECCCSVTKLCPILATPWTAAHQASLSFTASRHLLRFMSIELVMLFNLLIFCRPLLLPSVLPSIKVFPNELTSHQVAKVLEVQLQHQFFQWIFRVDFLLGLTGLIFFQSKELWRVLSLLKHHNSKSSLQCSAFFTVQLSHPYMIWKKNSFDDMDLWLKSDASAF